MANYVTLYSCISTGLLEVFAHVIINVCISATGYGSKSEYCSGWGFLCEFEKFNSQILIGLGYGE